MEKRAYLLVFGSIFLLGSILLFLLLLKADVFQQERITFNVSRKTTIGPLTKVEPKGTVETSPYVLLFWPAIFLTAGLFVVFRAFNVKEIENLLLGLILLLFGLTFVALKAPFPFVLIAWAFFVLGFLIIIISVKRLIF